MVPMPALEPASPGASGRIGARAALGIQRKATQLGKPVGPDLVKRLHQNVTGAGGTVDRGTRYHLTVRKYHTLSSAGAAKERRIAHERLVRPHIPNLVCEMDWIIAALRRDEGYELAELCPRQQEVWSFCSTAFRNHEVQAPVRCAALYDDGERLGEMWIARGGYRSARRNPSGDELGEITNAL
jgi:hypothetical protein